MVHDIDSDTPVYSGPGCKYMLEEYNKISIGQFDHGPGDCDGYTEKGAPESPTPTPCGGCKHYIKVVDEYAKEVVHHACLAYICDGEALTITDNPSDWDVDCQTWTPKEDGYNDD